MRPAEIGVAGGAFLTPPMDAPQGSAQHEDHCSWLQLPSELKQ